MRSGSPDRHRPLITSEEAVSPTIRRKKRCRQLLYLKKQGEPGSAVDWWRSTVGHSRDRTAMRRSRDPARHQAHRLRSRVTAANITAIEKCQSRCNLIAVQTPRCSAPTRRRNEPIRSSRHRLAGASGLKGRLPHAKLPLRHPLPVCPVHSSWPIRP